MYRRITAIDSARSCRTLRIRPRLERNARQGFLVDQYVSLIHANHDTLADLIEAQDLLIVDCWASWCGPCHRYSPIFEAVATATADATFASFQIDANHGNEMVFEEFGLSSVPTTLFFKSGQWVDTVAGALPKAKLEALVQSLRERALAPVA
jgi:thioredoxin